MLMPTPLSFTVSDGITLRGESLGDAAAPVVLLVHGGGQTRYAWGNTALQLAREGWRAISVDLRGHGDSDWPADGDYRLSHFGSDLRQIAAQLPSRPVVVGASLGGLSALVAEGEADIPVLAGVVLVDITPRLSGEGVGRILTFMRENVDDGFSSLEDAAAAVARYQPHRPKPKSSDGLARNLRQGADGRWRWHWDPRFVSGENRPHNDSGVERLSACAQRLAVPTLLVRGRVSDLVTPEAAREFLDLVPHAEFVDVGGAGHMIAGDRNDAFNEAIIDFLRRRFPVAG
jgi:pimeloyl-ACP methyl ester carboxylesterase